MRPTDLFDRDAEWADLERFATSATAGLRIGIVYGRRRQGKSYLLRRLCEAHDGLYEMALEHERAPALARFADAVAERLGLPTGQLRFRDWSEALRSAVDAVHGRGPYVIVLDEFPYLLRHSPELPSVLQELYDERSQRGPRVRLILCGSALSIMTELLSGSRALRGRAMLDLLLRPFDFRQAARFWGADDPEVAFQIDAIVGGTPGYRDLVSERPPRRRSGMTSWLAATLLNPSHALFRESEYLLREDPRVTDRALYQSVLTAIASGAGTPTAIGGLVGRDRGALAHPLDVLLTSGFIRRDDDLFLQRRPSYRVADPVVRFSQLVLEPHRAMLEDRRPAEALAAAQGAYRTGILGPHFETLAREWCSLGFDADAIGGEPGQVGHATTNDRSGRAQHDVDVVVLDRSSRPHATRPAILAIGEAKASEQPRSLNDLARLDRVRQLLVDRGVRAERASLLLFSRSGFDRELLAAARRRAAVQLIDLARLYGI